ncbi:MAG: PAS domain S-box protein, partial [Oceanospirillaceae bacterium]|nr:PAS domain S-box protein [Oceanospirillaceae bacterium]
MDTPGPHEGLSALTDDAERNRLLAEMAEQSTDMISRHTPGDWHFIYASPAVENLLGYSVDEIIGMSAYELYHPDDVEDFKRRSPSVSYERGLYTHTYRFRCKDGHYTWLESTSRSLRDPETGELKEILVVSRDASRRIEAEQTNRRLARVLESSSDLVAFIDLDNRVSNLNEAARERLGVDKVDDTLILRDLFHPQSYQQLLDEALPTAG